MRDRKTLYPLAIAVSVMLAERQGRASDTVTYTYDALGRLVAVSTSGTVNNGLSVSTGYDPAGNRSSYSVSGSGGPPPPPGNQPPPPPPGNQPPVAVDDSGSMTRCAEQDFAVLANDHDPDGNVPLALVSVSGGGTRGTPSISGTGILFTPNDVNGTAAVTYVMRDALGAADSATLTITIAHGSCPPQQLLSAEPAPEEAEVPEGDQ